MPNPRLPKAPRALAPASRHGACFTPILLRYLADLPLACSLVWDQDQARWHALAPFPQAPGLVEFEVNHREYFDSGRARYNHEMMKRSRETQALVIGKLGGFSDFFMPVLERGKVVAHLVCGPFRRDPLTALEIESQWDSILMRSKNGIESELMDYAKCALATPCLDSRTYAACVALLSSVAVIMGGASHPSEITERFLVEQAPALDTALPVVFRIARHLVDPSFSPSLRHPKMAWNFSVLGIEHMFTHALALSFEAREHETIEPLERLIRAHALQRYCFEIARESKDTISGPLGDYGAFFLTASEPGSKPEKGVLALGERIREQVRKRFGVSVCLGISRPTAAGEALPRCYEEALLALNRGLYEKHPLVTFREQQRKGGAVARSSYRAKVAELRAAIAVGAEGAAEIAAAPVGESILWHARADIGAMLACFQNLVLELLEAIDSRVGLDARSLHLLETKAFDELSSARSGHALCTVFQKLCAELSLSVKRPLASSRQARLEGARRYIDQNLRLPLNLKDAARAAGFSERYFSALFKQRFGVGFGKYLSSRRLERGRELLLTTVLPVTQVSREAGFASNEYFFRAFKHAYSATPSQYRNNSESNGADPSG